MISYCHHKMTIGYAVVALTCVLLLPATLCQRENRTCFCETSKLKHKCYFETLYCSPHDNNCNKENVALGKRVKVSSVYERRVFTTESCRGNNGIISVFQNTDDDPTSNCFHSNDFDYSATWEVFLERNYSIREMTIYGRSTHQLRMMYTIVEVNGKDCYRFPVGQNSSGMRDRTDVVCSQVVRGSEVMLRKPINGPRDRLQYYLNFCEVQVWVCKSGTYGENCDQFCSPQCLNCDNHDGRCWDGCKPGYYGIYCQNSCGQCRDPGCEQQTGNCLTGCDRGYQGATCTQACPADYYGYDCKQKCAGKCAGGQVCSRITGLCAAGCDAGWRGASCSDKCTKGTWGDACKNKCANCAENTECDNVDGKCLKGCKAGWTNSKCTDTCNIGTYGPNCERVCGACKKPTTCNSVSGLCPGGCDHGWMSEMCTVQCSHTTYGEDCKLNCSNCEEGQACDRVTGECHEGCKSGWHSAFCNESCPLGTYGKNCSEECTGCKNKNCKTNSGVCLEECNPGYKGPQCKELEKAESQSDKLPLGLIVGVAIGGCALLMLIITIIMLRAARNRRENEELEGLKKSDEVGIIQQQAPLVADGIEFQGGSTNYQTTTPQPEFPVAAEEIKASDENMPAEDQGVKEKPGMPKPVALHDSSGDTVGSISKGTTEESESEDE